jgi:hypothetical protein
MVLRVKKDRITQLIGEVSDFTFGPPTNVYSPLKPPKYPTPHRTARPIGADTGNQSRRLGELLRERVLTVPICPGATSQIVVLRRAIRTKKFQENRVGALSPDEGFYVGVSGGIVAMRDGE